MKYFHSILPNSKTSSRGIQLLSFTDTIPVNSTLVHLLRPYISCDPPSSLQRYGRLRISNEVYHAEIYEKPTKFNNAVISYNLESPYNEQEFFGIISFFCSLCKGVFAIVKPFTDAVTLADTENIFACNKTPGPFVFVAVNNSRIHVLCRYSKLCIRC